jgi:hypothetical protein
MPLRFFSSQEQLEQFREDVRSTMKEPFMVNNAEVRSIAETNLVRELRGSVPGVRKSRWSSLSSGRIWTLPPPAHFCSMVREAGFDFVQARTPGRNNPARIVVDRRVKQVV